MNGVNSYAAYDNYYSSTINNKSNDTKAASGRKTNSSQNSVSQPKLSDKAQDLLEKLKKTYKNMDFMVAGKGDDAKKFFRAGQKNFLCCFQQKNWKKWPLTKRMKKNT